MDHLASNREHTRFLRCAFTVACAAIVLAAGLAILVDPYGLFRLVQVPGFNTVKPRPERYQEEIKLTVARALRPEVVIAGNSRAEIGLDPSHETLLARHRSAYNLAIPGTSILATRRQLDHLHSVGQTPRMIILGVEFLDFLVDPAIRRRQVAAAGAGHKVDSIVWKVDTVLSLTALWDSLATLRLQDDPEGKTLSTNGFNPLLEYKRYAREGGYYALFQQRAEEYAGTFVRLPHQVPGAETGTSPDLDALRDILRMHAPATELHLVIYPYHAQILAMFEATGLWPAFEQWKAILAQEVANTVKAHPGARITLWDFSGFSTFQCEPIPPGLDKKKETRWYWEAGHFKSELGSVMLSRIMDSPRNPRTVADFGYALTPRSLDENRSRIARERSACAAHEPEIFTNAIRVVRKAAVPMH